MFSKKAILLLFAAFTIVNGYSQNLFLDIYGGAINYGGDLQAKNFTLQRANLAAGLGLTYRLGSHLSIAAAYMHGKVDADDKLSYPPLAFRNLSFSTSINEGSLRLEGDLWAIPEKRKVTPYAFAGISVYSFNPYSYDSTGKKVYLQPLGTEGQGLSEFPEKKPYSLMQFAIPFGFGFKYALSPEINVGAELAFRKLFTDYFDDVSTNYVDTALLSAAHGPYASYFSFRGDELKPPVEFQTNGKRGNPDFNDNFYTISLKISFSLGNGSGRTMSSGSSKRFLRQSNCPKNL